MFKRMNKSINDDNKLRLIKAVLIKAVLIKVDDRLYIKP